MGRIFSMYDNGLPSNSSMVGKNTGANGTSNRPSAHRPLSSFEFCIAWWRKRSSAAVVAWYACIGALRRRRLADREFIVLMVDKDWFRMKIEYIFCFEDGRLLFY